jgi:hypothetical protein
LRERIAAQLFRMDTAHLELARSRGDDVELLEPSVDWRHPEVARWPSFAPASEKAIVATLALQTDMLLGVLRRRDPALAEEMASRRGLRKLRDPSERFYGDRRDQFVSLVLELMSQANALQATLGARAGEGWGFPTAARSSEDVESYLVGKMAFVADQAEALASAEPRR